MSEQNYRNIIDSLVSVKTIDEVINLFQIYGLKRKDKNKYPDIIFSINNKEIDILKQSGIINDDNKFSSSLSSDKGLSTLEKILYGIIWKNGDLGKEEHIISGILGIKSNTGVVFNQFGRYLNNKNEIIIDQHVLRAYIFYKTDEIIKDIKPRHYDAYLDEYKSWINDNIFFNEHKSLIDEFLLMLGKMMKDTVF